MLIVEDEVWFAELFATAANTQEVRIATTMKEALAMIDRKPPNFVVLDLSLPDSKPTETMDLIRSIKDRTDNAVVIVITGDDRPETRMRALQRGADSFMVKGSNTDIFMERLKEQVRRASRRMEPCASRETIEAIEKKVGEMTGLDLAIPRATIRILMRVAPMLRV